MGQPCSPGNSQQDMLCTLYMPGTMLVLYGHLLIESSHLHMKSLSLSLFHRGECPATVRQGTETESEFV